MRCEKDKYAIANGNNVNHEGMIAVVASHFKTDGGNGLLFARAFFVMLKNLLFYRYVLR